MGTRYTRATVRLAVLVLMVATLGCQAVAAPTAIPPMAVPPTAVAPIAVVPPTSAPAANVVPASAVPVSPTPVPRNPAESEVILATTTSTQDSGLLDVLVPLFEKQSGYRVKTISVGTGASLALGARGEADVVLVHAPEAEKLWMAQGNGTERILVMHNDFVILGPPNDPAEVKGEKAIGAALKKIADKGVLWVSRDDNSGTDQLEKQLWKNAVLAPKGQAWYLISGQGMGATLTLADQKSAYTISDRATYLARKSSLQSAIAVEGARELLNIYSVMPVNPAKFPGVAVNTVGGKAFAAFLVASETQRLIGEFGKDKYGQALFVPDAGKTEGAVGA